MERKDAITYLKDFFTENNLVSPNAVTIDPLKDAKGYSIKIQIGVSERDPIKETAKKHNLSIEEDNDFITIYKLT